MDCTATSLTSVQTIGRPPWPERVVYIGMPGKAARGWGIPDADVGPFGKPWACKDDPRGWEIAYREYLWTRIRSDADFALAIAELHGKRLACWCTAKAATRGTRAVCHGETLMAAAEWLHHGIHKEK